MEIYTTNDALNILYRYGIRAPVTLKDYLHKGISRYQREHYEINSKFWRKMDLLVIREKVPLGGFLHSLIRIKRIFWIY